MAKGINAAVFWPPKDKAYFFEGTQYIRYEPGEGVDNGPWSTQASWTNWPASFAEFDAAIFWPSNEKAYFFKGKDYIRYTPDKGVDEGYPKTIRSTWTNWPESFKKVDAAIFWPPNGKAYFFSGSQYVRYTPGQGIDEGYPKSIRSSWTNWPESFEKVDGAVFWPSNEKAYFFSGSQYVRYTPGQGVDEGFPASIHSNWNRWPASWTRGLERFDNFDAVTFQSTDEYYWFFKGDRCWRKEYGGSNTVEYKGKISTQFPGVGSDLTDLDAAVYNGEKYWFFKGNKCWSKEHGRHNVKYEGRIDDNFEGVPADLDAACFSKDKYWFFKGANCWSKRFGRHKVISEGAIASNFSGASLPSPIDAFTLAKDKYWFFAGKKCWSKKYGGSHKVQSEGEILNQFPYYPLTPAPESWMEDSLATIGEKFLWQVSMPGTHDSGMSSMHSPTVGAAKCNVVTQSKTILQQLRAGVRYFDIRPVIGSGKFYTGHYSDTETVLGWQGARGESIESVIKDVNSFTSDQRELVVLNLSHAYDTDSDYSEFSETEWESLLDMMTGQLDHLFVTQKDLLSEIKIKEYLRDSSAVLLITPDDAGYPSGKGVYSESEFEVFDEYSETNNLNDMIDDQLGKMESDKPRSDRLFLLSWTLTQSTEQVVSCKVGSSTGLPDWIPGISYDPTSIKDLASRANKKLYRVMSETTAKNFPNIVSVDYFPEKALSVAVYSNMLR